MLFRLILAALSALVLAHADSILNQPFPQEARTSYAFGAGLPGNTLPDGSKLADVTSIELTDDGRVVAAAISTMQNIELLEFDGQTWRWLRPFFDHVSDSQFHGFVASTSGRAYRSDDNQTLEANRIVDGSRGPDGMKVIATASKIWEDTQRKRRVAFESRRAHPVRRSGARIVPSP